MAESYDAAAPTHARHARMPWKDVAAIIAERDRLRDALKCFAHLAEGEVFAGLPDSHLFELVWASDEVDRIDEETGKPYPTVTAGQLRRARAALAKAEGV